VAAKDRSTLMAKVQSVDSPLQSLHRLALRSMLHPVSAAPHTANSSSIDSVVVRPSWVVPFDPKGASNGANSAALLYSGHSYDSNRAEEESSQIYGLDWRSGSPRDWNEELQVAREMPTTTLAERIDRARMVHKVLSDFGEASMMGAKGIFEGAVLPMNPNEAYRAHVYLHNNIFYSRAVDSGLDTFKVCSGDDAAKKSVSRDAGCTGALHGIDIQGLHTLATVVVDYMGIRLVCQSIVPGILHGDKSHSLLYGTVDSDACLHTDAEMHKLLDETVGEAFMVASRPVPVLPLSDARMKAIADWKEEHFVSFISPEDDEMKKTERETRKNETTVVCGPIEVKGIKGSDQRKYLLDLTRLTARDANWVPESEGGTGKWESVMADVKGKKATKFVPSSLADDEWTMAVLRRELVTSLTHKKMVEWKKAKKPREKDDKKENKTPETGDEAKKDTKDEREEAEEIATREKKLDEEGEAHLKSLRYNVNVFLPNTKSIEDLDKEAYEQIKKDEDHVRDAAVYVWDNLLPHLTKEVKEGSG
jgi:protein TIF31